MNDFSVVIATCDPHPHILSWALDSLERQTLSRERFEVIIVDNNSRRPVAELPAIKQRSFRLRVVHEPQVGTTAARCRGITEAQANWIVFLDDDNYLDPDYLEQAAHIIAGEPGLGAFGGIARFLSDAPQPGWATPLLPYLGVRDFGSQPITSRENRWGEWEPIGAGMVFRKEVGEAFRATVESDGLARRLGRHKKSFICGEDSLVARSSYAFGYACSYQPALKLTHFIRCSRLRPKMLARTIAGAARAWVICETVLGTSQFTPSGPLRSVYEFIMRTRDRVRRNGLKAGVVEASWDIGYMRQVRTCLRERS